jgi:hypothetical protein
MTKKKKPNGFFKKMTKRQLTDYVRENHYGKSLKEFEDADQSACNTARELGLINSLVEERILIRKQKISGFYTGMNNEQFKEYVTANYKGRTLEEFRMENGSASHYARERGLVSQLVDSGVLIRKARAKSFFGSMTKKQFVAYVKEHYAGKTLSEFSDTDGAACNQARKRKVIGKLVSQGILIRKRTHGKFSRMTKKELKNYILKEHRGDTMEEFRTNSPGAYDLAREQGLVEDFVERGIITRKKKPNGYFNAMSDEEIKSYVRENYQGKTITYFAKKDSAAYNKAREKGMVKDLVEAGILIEAKTKYRGYASPLECFEIKFKGKKMTRAELCQKDRGLYVSLHSWGQIDEAIPEKLGVTYRGYASPLECFRAKYGNEKMTQAELKRKDRKLLDALYHRNQLNEAIPPEDPKERKAKLETILRRYAHAGGSA